MYLLNYDNAKTPKGEAFGYRTAIQYFASHERSGRNVCPSATEGCSDPCLVGSGYGQMPVVEKARIERTLFYFNEPERYHEMLNKEVRKLLRLSERDGLKPACRLNGTSDLPELAFQYAKEYPDIQWYDYTKIYKTLLRDDIPSNLHYTFSRSEKNEGRCFQALELGYNFSAVFERIPKQYKGIPVIDGMKHDCRFLDPKGVIVGLLPLGRMKHDTKGMVIRGL